MPMIIAAVSYWIIGIPCAYILGFVLGWEGVGVWLGLVVGFSLCWCRFDDTLLADSCAQFAYSVMK